MKLNLLPTTVNREGRAKSAWFFSLILVVAGVAAMLFMKQKSELFVTQQKDRIEKARPTVEEGVKVVTATEALVTANRGMIMNAQLAAAIGEHSDRYPDLYTEIKGYIPSFFRVTEMGAAPLGPEGTQVNITGIIQTQQQYADLMLALLRIKDVVSVGRTGFNYANALVPPLTEQDQTGRIQNPGDPTWPDDPLARLDAQIAQARSTGFLNEGGFGSTVEPMQRGAMPDWSLINIAVIVRKNTQAPNPIAAIRETAGMWPKPDMTKAGGPASGGGGNNTPAPNNAPRQGS